MLSVSFPKKLVKEFKKAAIKVFPREEFAILLGNRHGKIFKIEELYFPKNRSRFCSTEDIILHPKWFRKARKYAKKKGMILLGDIHSHPREDELPSGDDWDETKYLAILCRQKHIVFGIMALYKIKRKFTSDFRVWPRIKEVKLTTP